MAEGHTRDPEREFQKSEEATPNVQQRRDQHMRGTPTAGARGTETSGPMGAVEQTGLPQSGASLWTHRPERTTLFPKRNIKTAVTK